MYRKELRLVEQKLKRRKNEIEDDKETSTTKSLCKINKRQYK
jgi:hypothetical protein